MGEASREVETALREALGLSLGAPASPATLIRDRVVEDDALDAWAVAVADYEHARGERREALRRAEAAVHRRMAPLSPARYVRLEQTLALTRRYHHSPAWVGDMIHVQRTRRAVDAARQTLATLAATEDARLTEAREARATATAALIGAFGIGRAAHVTGLSPQRLGLMRAGR